MTRLLKLATNRLGLSFAVVTALVVASLVACQFRKDPEIGSSAAPNALEAPGSEELVTLVRAANSPKGQKPPGEFREGHVKPRQQGLPVLTRSGRGFAVQLPSKAPVPTPTVYQGKVYVSGGFHSKEFYCFDATSGELVWALDLDDDGPSSPVCSEGLVVFNTESCTIFAVDALTGVMKWSWWLGDPLMSMPTVASGRVFTSYPAAGQGGPQQLDTSAAAVGTAPTSHALACFDLHTGKILWQRWIDSEVMTAPVASDDELFVTTFGGTVYTFDQESGNLESVRAERATSAPLVTGEGIYFTRRSDQADEKTVREGIAARDPRTGAHLFLTNVKAAPYLDEEFQSNTRYWGQGLSLDAGNGFTGGAPLPANVSPAAENIGLAQVSTLQAFQGSRLLRLGARHFNCMGDEILCSDARSGEKVWSLKLDGDLRKEGGVLAAPPSSAGGQLFVAKLDGSVLQIDPQTSKVTGEYEIGSPLRSQPVIDGGRIYATTEDGRLVCVETGDERLTGWPTWGGNARRTGIVQ